MFIKTKLSKSDYVEANFALLFASPVLKIVFGLGLAVLVLEFALSTVMKLFLLDAGYYLGPILFLAFIPISFWFRIRKNYSANQRVAEEIQYRFTSEHLILKGESFSIQSTWDKVFKVTQTKKWIFIWQSPQSANIIAKKYAGEEAIASLKEILDEHGVKNTL